MYKIIGGDQKEYGLRIRINCANGFEMGVSTRSRKCVWNPAVSGNRSLISRNLPMCLARGHPARPPRLR